MTTSTHNKGTIPDLIIYNRPNLVADVSVVTSNHSNHYMVFFSINSFCPCTGHFKSFSVYDYSKADTQGMTDCLLDHGFSPFFCSFDVKYLWSYLKDLLNYAISIFVPRVKISSKNYPK